MKVKPLQDVLIVELEEAQTVTSGGIIRPDTAPDPIAVGRVLAVGPGKPIRKINKNKPGAKETGFLAMEAKPGDRVVFMAANLDTRQGKQLCYLLGDGVGLIRETDVLFVCEDPDLRIEV